jgi:phosphoribosylformimino-5-aminoimidazole carboxamide ribotide isomerase
MLIIPAIDLRAGRCVRLLRGDFARETIYADDPVAVARRWRQAGAELVHVVDLDGAREGRPLQLDIVQKIAEVAPVELGGGVRALADVERVMEAGVERVVLGTAALDRKLIAAAATLYGSRLLVALDTRDGLVLVRGWVEKSRWTMLDLARELMAAGVQRFLHTDVERDGTLTTPNYASLEALIALGLPVIASGGVASLEHIERLKDIGAEAAIVGRALYEGTIDLAEAMTVAG